MPVNVKLGMKMRQLLEERIRAVFPKGNDWEHDDKELDANSYVQRINCVNDGFI